MNRIAPPPVLNAPVQNQPKANQPQAVQSVRPAGDTFVRSALPLNNAAARPMAQPLTKLPPSTQDLGFADLMAKDPGMIWQTALTPRTEQAMAAYKRGLLGRSVRNLDLRNMSATQVRGELQKKGFQCEMGTVKDVRTGQPVINPRTGRPVPMEIWSHADGGMVRIKPEGDPTSRFRPQPHLSVSVKYPPDADGHDFNDEAFKVDFSGNALPKWAKDVKNPFPADTPAGKKFLDDVADRTHTNLR